MLDEVLKKYNYKHSEYKLYGEDIAKVNIKNSDKKGKLILVTSINPTPFGEGKTTISIGLSDALCKLDKKSIVVLREPSLGPVFGTKGGACGGGESTIEPINEINLHFTGDIHAIESANNLICAAIDNHIYFDNKLNIDINSIAFHRCIDLNDRSLRNVEINITKNIKRIEHFDITAASEIMAILCMSSSFNDLKNRIDNIYIGNDTNGKMLYVKDLHITNAICSLLTNAIKPNAVLTKEGNLAFVHGGPFANVSHGCSSLISIKSALNIADYVVTEAGFGSDLGGFKFIDILSRNDLKPDLVVINVTIRALKYHGNGNLKEGFSNLDFHIKNMNTLSDNILVVLNKFDTDKLEDIELLENYLKNKKINFSECDNFNKGSLGSLAFAHKTLELLKNENKIHYLYNLEESLEEKIKKVLNHMGASEIKYTSEALKKLNLFNNFNFPICIAKTHKSISDDEKLLGFPKNYTVTIKDIKLSSGASYIVVYLGNIITLPGLALNARLYD